MFYLILFSILVFIKKYFLKNTGDGYVCIGVFFSPNIFILIRPVKGDREITPFGIIFSEREKETKTTHCAT